MSSPAEFYNSLPPISKAYGTICLATTVAYHLGLCDPYYIALYYPFVFRLQVWRLVTNFFFLGNFSINFGIRLLMIARYGVQLEKGPFDRRTADFLWMVIFGAFALLALAAIPWFYTSFLGVSLVFMLLYVWSREFPNAQINMYGLVQLKAFYLPWAMLALDVIFGSPIMPDLLGIIAGHLYYFLTVLHPLAGGRTILKTPNWVYPPSLYSVQSMLPSPFSSRVDLVNVLYLPILSLLRQHPCTCTYCIKLWHGGELDTKHMANLLRLIGRLVCSEGEAIGSINETPGFSVSDMPLSQICSSTTR